MILIYVPIFNISPTEIIRVLRGIFGQQKGKRLLFHIEPYKFTDIFLYYNEISLPLLILLCEIY